MKYALLIAAAAAGLSAPAYAQDLSGFRIEARAGWERAATDATLPNPDYDEEDEETGGEFLTASDNDSGIAFGGEVGYDFQLGSSFVVGAYAGVDLSDAKVCSTLIEDDLACTGLDRTFTAGARAGVPIGETSLLYVKGGYSNGKFDTTYDADVTDNDDEDADPVSHFSKSMGGYHLGGGFELGLSRNLYAKLEYVYTDYGSTSHRLGDEEGDPALDVGSNRHLAVVGVGLRF